MSVSDMTAYKRLKQQKNLIMGDIADMLGVSVAQVSKWENGIEDMPANYYENIMERMKALPDAK